MLSFELWMPASVPSMSTPAKVISSSNPPKPAINTNRLFIVCSLYVHNRTPHLGRAAELGSRLIDALEQGDGKVSEHFGKRQQLFAIPLGFYSRVAEHVPVSGAGKITAQKQS